MKKAVIYARVSSKRQAADGLPIESQLDQCRAKAAAMGAEILREFVDGGVSGTTDKRPAFQNAINFCSVMDVDYFITWSSSRFARNVVDAGRYKLVLQTARTKLVYVSGEVDTETDDGWLMDGFNALLDENYSRRVSTDTRRSMIKAARDGYFMGGRVPFGYAAVQDGNRRRLAVHPAESEVIKRMFQMSLQGTGVKLIAMALNDLGQLLRGRRWAKNTVNFMLTNEVYCGISTFNKVSNRVPNAPDLWIRVESHPPIIEVETFNQVQRSLETRRPERVGGLPQATGLFSGMLRCGFCDSALTMTHGTGRDGTRHFYYGCNAHMRGKARCSFKNVRIDALDPSLLAQLMEKVITERTVAKVVDESMEASRGWSKDRQLRRGAAVKALRELESRRSKLYSVLELMGADAPNLADIGPRLRQLNDEIKNLEADIARIEAEPVLEREFPKLDVGEVTGMLRGLVQDCKNVKTVRTFLASFIEKATVSGETVAVHYNAGRMMSYLGPAVPRENKWLLNLGSNQGPTD